MTVAPDVPRLAVADPDEAIRRLREAGLRLSTARRLIIEALFAADGPVSAQEIARDSGMPEADPSSVYRNLERLEELGVIRHVHLGHGPSRYMLVGGGEREFLLCERCGRVRSVEPADLDPVRERIEADFGYRARFGHFPIVGLCSDCSRT